MEAIEVLKMFTGIVYSFKNNFYKVGQSLPHQNTQAQEYPLTYMEISTLVILFILQTVSSHCFT